MASTSILSTREEDLDWEITGLGNDFTPANYIRCGIALESVSSGQSTAPDYIIDTVSSAAGNTNETGSQDTSDRMTPNQTYTFYGFAQAGNGLYYPAGSDSGTMDEMTIDEIILSRVADLDWSAIYYADYYQVFWNTTPDVYAGEGAVTTSSVYTITGLQPSTTYYYTVEVVEIAGIGGDAVDQGIRSFTTLEDPRPDNWTWTTDFYAGKEVAVVGNEIEILPASEWNSFTSRINEFRAYKGLSAYSFSNAYTGNEVMASYINQARTAISAMSPSTSVPSSVSSGSSITAYVFTRLRDSLNSIS